VALLLWRDPVFNLRLVTESDADWYGASYSAPAALDLEANRTATVELEVQNQGRIPWATDGAHPFALGYRWLTSDGNGVLDVAPAEVPLPREVQPGEPIHLQALVSVPDLPAGSYRLDWGMLQRDVLQFYERGWADAETTVRIQPGTGASSAAMPAVLSRDDGEAPWVVGRLDLWSVALRLFASHPLLGVGPDNFRHYYGAELGLEGWDERIQANNLYLEILADLGVLGLASFAWVVLGPLRGLWRAFMRGGFEGLAGAPMSLEGTAQTSLEREAEGREGTRLTSLSREAELAPAAQLGVALALGAFLLHGLLDSFLAFTPTAVVFWLLLGLAQAQKPHVSGR
jgi:hypothetical protein